MNLRVKVQGTGQIIHLRDSTWCTIKRCDDKTALISYKFYISRSELDLEITKLKSQYRVKVKRFVDKGVTTPIYAKVYYGNSVLFNVHRGYAPQILVPPKPIKPLPPKLIKPLPPKPIDLVTHVPRNCVYPNAKKMPQKMVTIIILTYNTRDVTCNCIRSVLKKTIHPFELFVVDNASKDGTVQALKKQSFMTLIANSKNVGFSKGNNKGIRRARGKHVCLVNSDIIVRRKGWLKKMVKVAESDSKIATVGAKLLYPDGRIQHIGGAIHSLNPYHPYDKYIATAEAAHVTRDVPYNTGACLLITRTGLEKVGLLDEEYPFGFEDVDYGLRVVEMGLRNVMCHEAVLTHLWAYTQRTTGRHLKTPSLRRYHRLWDSRLSELAEKIKLDWGAPYCV